jgi:pimeloyl-ACP methyl ester carboxylesterase
MHFIGGKVTARFVDFGVHQLKNLDKPIRAYVVSNGTTQLEDDGTLKSVVDEVEVRYCRTSDGVNIAYAAVGNGPPLVKAASFLTHLEFENESPVWRHWFSELSKGYSYIRYDERGNGLSDWDVEDISFEAFVKDLEIVVDELGLNRFPLLGISQGCAVSVAYAVRHPGRVSCLILCGGYAVGWLNHPDEDWRKRRSAMLDLIPVGWGEDNPAFRQVYTSLFVPEGTREQHDWFNELQKISASPDNAYRIMNVFAAIDVRDLLEQVNVPTMVLHCRGDAVVPFDSGRQLAAAIPNARFVALDGSNHVILKEDKCWPRFLSEVRGFLAKNSI